jgi:hypothetical protein
VKQLNCPRFPVLPARAVYLFALAGSAMHAEVINRK